MGRRGSTTPDDTLDPFDDGQEAAQQGASGATARRLSVGPHDEYSGM